MKKQNLFTEEELAKERKTTQSLLCLYQQEQTHDTSTTLYSTDQKSDLSKVA